MEKKVKVWFELLMQISCQHLESKSERHKLWARRSLGGERSGGWSEMQGGNSEREVQESDLGVMGGYGSELVCRETGEVANEETRPPSSLPPSRNEGSLFQRYHKIILFQFILYVCHKVSGLPL